VGDLNNRTSISAKIRTTILLANRHSCCICGRADIQIHHINGNNSDNVEANLAVLCLTHHNQATAPKNLTAALTPDQVCEYKKAWEEQCRQHSILIARSRSAFFMVDYKNAERIRQLYSQLTSTELLRAQEKLRHEFQHEDKLRKEQGFDISLEPNTAWTPLVEELLSFVRTGDPHPSFFKDWKGHEMDPLLPVGFQGSIPTFGFYDIWCQIMVRAIIACRGTYDLNDLMALKDPTDIQLHGKLVSFEGHLRGNVALPSDWRTKPLSKAALIIKDGSASWKSVLEFKTHYVYSMTAASSLSRGRQNGILFLRSIDSVETKKRGQIVTFSCTPLILGCGGGGALKISSNSIN
jgi:hypothetical protein